MIVDLERRWQTQAACGGMDVNLFFTDHAAEAVESPTAKLQSEWDRAKEVCRKCPVIRECGRDHLGETEGVWGGMDPAERYRARRRLGVELHTMTGTRKIEYAKLVYDLRQVGRPVAAICRLIGISAQTAHYLEDWYKDHLAGRETDNSPPKNRHFKQVVTEEDIRQIIALRRTGLTLGQVATRVGYSEHTVRKYIRERAPELLKREVRRGTKEVRTIEGPDTLTAAGASELLDAG